MDPHHDAQDMARCDLCEIAIVQSYCDFCHVYLCTPCIGEHISNEYDKHKIVPFQLRRSTPIYPKCEKHQKKVCEYQCKDCNISLCSHCLASEQHNKEHKLLTLEEVFRKKKEYIKRDKEEINKQLLPAYEDIISELEKKIANLDVDYMKLFKDISIHREELHKEIDDAMNQKEKEIGDNKTKHRAILRKQLDEIKELQSFMKETLHALNEMDNSNKVSPIIHYNSKNQEFSKLPQKMHVLMPKFVSKSSDKEVLYSLIGRVTPLSTTPEERVFKGKKSSSPVRELLDEPEILNTIKTGHGRLRGVACLNEEEIWTSGETADINCFNHQSVLQTTIKTMSGRWPVDIAVYSDGALVYSDWKNKTVNEVKNNRTEMIIRLQGWIPTQLCVTSSGDLLVTMYNDYQTQSKVVRYSGSTVKQTIQFDDNGQPLYSGNRQNKYITENGNLDACVADRKAGVVVVVNQAGKLRFRYPGHLSSTKNKQFEPVGITTDSQNHILTGDRGNNWIHILDVDGEFLRYIDNCSSTCELEFPTGLFVDNDNSLLVCEYFKGNVKKIRYLK